MVRPEVFAVGVFALGAAVLAACSAPDATTAAGPSHGEASLQSPPFTAPEFHAAPGQPATPSAVPAPAASLTIQPASAEADKQVGAHLTPGTSRGFANDLTAKLAEIVAQVHSDGGLLKSRVIGVGMPDASGKYVTSWSPSRLKADPFDYTTEIRISPKKPGVLATMAHELGHKIDREAIMTVHGAVKNQEAKVIRDQILTACRASARAADIKAISQTAHRVYLENDGEWMARAYAQYLMERSGNAELKSLWKTDLAHTSVYTRVTVWEKADFAPIAKLFDDLFIKLGWAVRP